MLIGTVFVNPVTYVAIYYIIKQCHSHHTKIAKQHKMKLTAVFVWRFVAARSLKTPTPSSTLLSLWTITIVIDTKTTESSASQKCKQTDIDSFSSLYTYSISQYVYSYTTGTEEVAWLRGVNLGKGKYSYTVETLMLAFLLRYLRNSYLVS